MDAITSEDDSVTQPDTFSIDDELLELHQKILLERSARPLDDNNLIERVRHEREAEIFPRLGPICPRCYSKKGMLEPCQTN